MHKLWWTIQLHKESVQHTFAMWSFAVMPTNHKSLLSFGYAELCSIIVPNHDRHSKAEGQLPCKVPSGPGRSFQISCWSSKSISFDSCLCLGAALDFPHFLFVAGSASLPHLSIE